MVTRQPVYEYAVASDVKPVLSCAFNEDSAEKSDSQNESKNLRIDFSVLA